MSPADADARAIPDVLAAKGLRLTVLRRAVVEVLIEQRTPLRASMWCRCIARCDC
jgi:Fe2+ or Zn2+ uptake regulation protein